MFQRNKKETQNIEQKIQIQKFAFYLQIF